MFSSVDEWKQYVETNWKSLYEEASNLELIDPYQLLMAMLFLPVSKATREERTSALKKLKSDVAVDKLIESHYDILLKVSGKDIKRFIVGLEQHLFTNWHERIQMDELILSFGILPIMYKDPAIGKDMLSKLIEYFRNVDKQPSGVRVIAESLTSGENIIIAGRDVNFIVDYYKSDKAALRTYLNELRLDWGFFEINSILMNPSKQISTQVHDLYAPIDVWDNRQIDLMSENEMSDLRVRSVENDLTRFRISVLESVALHPYVVLTGGPGTGKSTFCRFLAISLSYLCDTDAEKEDDVRGKDLLGSAWVHGPLMPVYVNLRSFAGDKKHFPKTMRSATVTNFLKYLRSHAGDFGDYLDKYLKQRDDNPYQAVLILDGLDEIYEEDERKRVSKMIDAFAERYDKCRIIVSCRTAIYQQDVKDSLSERFTKLAIAPYTWKQIGMYVMNWYEKAASNRPGNFGGREHAKANTESQALDLIKTLRSTESLWSIARQPLLLVLITFIHETQRGLPRNRADLYERAVELLHKWNPPNAEESIARKLLNLDYTRLRQVLQLIAFELQRDNSKGIKGAVLMQRLMTENKQEKLGAAVQDVFTHLTTRNGILVAAEQDEFHFLHLSIQEYLAACALMGQYDRLNLKLKTDSKLSEEETSFPRNICNLSLNDSLRWREVVLFCGSILAGQAGQDGRWNFIEHLLPKSDKADLSHGEVTNIYLAAEIWDESPLRCQLRTHHEIHKYLITHLERVITQQRLDIPEQSRAKPILAKLKASK